MAGCAASRLLPPYVDSAPLPPGEVGARSATGEGRGTPHDLLRSHPHPPLPGTFSRGEKGS